MYVLMLERVTSQAREAAAQFARMELRCVAESCHSRFL